MVLSEASASGLGLHSLQSASPAFRVAFVQPHPMSLGRVIFLVIIVAFFCGLFVGSYIWMRRPRFGQARGLTHDFSEGPMLEESSVPPSDEVVRGDELLRMPRLRPR